MIWFDDEQAKVTSFIRLRWDWHWALIIRGGGAWSLDYFLTRKQKQ